MNSSDKIKKLTEKNLNRTLDRREFLKASAVAAGVAVLAACDSRTREQFFRKHFKELSPEEIKALIATLKDEYKEKYNKEFNVKATAPMEGVEFGYALDLSRCIGCRRCVYACVDENNQSREPQIHWIKVLEMEKERGIDVTHSDIYYEREEVPEEGHFYMPVQCQQCRNPACVKVCPVQATWKEKDGVVVIDYDWCIGCRYCMAACPYGARHFNWGTPTVPEEEINTDVHILGNRPRSAGVVEKCHFCLQRSREGRYPACLEVCPVGARKFGNILDPESEISYIFKNKRVFILKEELNTQPRFYYFYGT